MCTRSCRLQGCDTGRNFRVSSWATAADTIRPYARRQGAVPAARARLEFFPFDRPASVVNVLIIEPGERGDEQILVTLRMFEHGDAVVSRFVAGGEFVIDGGIVDDHRRDVASLQNGKMFVGDCVLHRVVCQAGHTRSRQRMRGVVGGDRQLCDPISRSDISAPSSVWF